MAFGFMVNESTVVGVQDFYDISLPIKMGEFTSVDEYARVMPQAGYVSQFDLQLLVTSGSPRCAKIILTWDDTGNDLMWRETESEKVVTGLTTGTMRMLVFPVGTFLRAPSTQTTLGEVYAWAKVDRGTVTVQRARLHWATRHWG